ncbi:MAG: Arm DNA-binding domain-containing protein [bacterium]
MTASEHYGEGVTVMPLTDTAIGNATPGEKPIKHFAGGGLYLLQNPNGSRWWRFDYRFAGKRRTLSMGVYPAVGLKQALETRTIRPATPPHLGGIPDGPHWLIFQREGRRDRRLSDPRASRAGNLAGTLSHRVSL